MKNNFEEPLTVDNSKARTFLEYFANWIEEWRTSYADGGKLTKETFTALSHTTYALLEITDYCIQKLHAKYVLLEKFQTDCLEARFGQYRQLAGGNYDVSLRQIYECEKKIRLMSVLNLKLKGKEVNLTNFSIDWEEYFDNKNLNDIPILISFEEWENAMEYLPVITYIAGYCCYSTAKKLQCDECKERITNNIGEVEAIENNLISRMTRGGLLYPCSDIVQMVMVNYIIVNKLAETAEFQSAMSQRQLVLDSTMSALESEELNSFFFRDNCKKDHETIKVAKFILWASTNILLNNLCFKNNDKLVQDKRSKKRKLQTVS